MLSLTNKQIATIARLQQLAAMTYNKHEYPGPVAGDQTVSIAQLTDDGAVADARGVIAQCGGALSRAVVVAVRYVGSEWAADDGPTVVPVIVLPDGTPIGAPYELTGEVTVTARFDLGQLDDDTPAPNGYDLECTLGSELTAGLAMVAARVWQKHHRCHPRGGAAA